jgi:sigma-B regulation protein RsbU (phosphoserine phosphatase)
MNDERPPILIVDDDSAVLRTYLRVLRAYAPMHAEDGIEARQILSTTRVDVVLCDLGMPRMSGLDLMRWAKEHCPTPLWIVISGQDTFEAAAQALKLGAFDFVPKPIQSVLQLRTVVANAVRQQALVAERTLLIRSLASNNVELAEGHRRLEESNAVLREQQAMLEQDLERAERILWALLPHALRPIEGLQVNVAYRPKRSIGGDFYGAAMLDDRHLAVFVADAAGHGVSAALLAVLFHQQLSALDAEPCPRTPAAVLSALNRGLLEECRASGLFLTAVYALMDTTTRTATVASAGHPPALLCGTGTTELFDKTGPALGLEPDATYAEHRIALREGDRLLLYTDGLTGAMQKDAPALDSIVGAGASHREDGSRVVERLLAWTERERVDDDMTLLLVTASSGWSTVEARKASAPRPAPIDSTLSIGSRAGTTWVVVHGRGTWKDAAVLRETCIQALDAARAVVVDLASCTMLDSTILGTLHELVVRGEPERSLRVQGASETVRGLFEELAMTQVLASIAPGVELPPPDMIELRPKGDASAQGLVLHAHELLAGLSASNAEQFQPVIDALKSEVSL